MRLGRLGFKNKLLVRRVSVITGIEVGFQFANNGTSRGPGGVWRGGFHPSAFNTKEDLRIVKEEVQGQSVGEQEQSNTTTYINHVKPWCSRPLDGHERVWETHGAHAGACLGPSWALLGCSAGRFGHPLGHVGVSWPVSRHIDDTYG